MGKKLTFEEAKARLFARHGDKIVFDGVQEWRGYDYKYNFIDGYFKPDLKFTAQFNNVISGNGARGNKGKRITQARSFITKEFLHTEALKYSYRSEFQEKDPANYSNAVRLKVMDEICSHMKAKQYGLRGRLVYAIISFPKVYIGLTCNLDKRINNHLLYGRTEVKKSLEKGHVFTLTDLLSEQDAIIAEKYWVSEFASHTEWEVLNKATPGGLGVTKVKWTDQLIRIEYKKHSTYTAFCEESYQAYYRALQNPKLLQEIKKYFNAAQNKRHSKQSIFKELENIERLTQRTHNKLYQAIVWHGLKEEVNFFYLKRGTPLNKLPFRIKLTPNHSSTTLVSNDLKIEQSENSKAID